jgi:RHS repeat-associated protein
VTAYNDAGNTTPVVTAYTYNKRRLLTGETLSQPTWYSWSVGYNYNQNGVLANQIYPTGLNIDYAPNALGQPTKAGNYASGAQYYPNGALKQFTYGNGIVHTMTQNTRQLPVRVTDSGNALDYDYAYDSNANIERIYDYVTGTPTLRHRWMGYDGLDRLTSAASAVFGGSEHTHRFTYDALDNITSWKVPGIKDYAEYVYESSTNRLTSIRNTTGATVVGIGYDVQGNLANKNGQTYDFDYGNRLRSVIGKEYYRYDGLGRRVLAWEPATNSILSQYTQSGQIVYQENHRTSVASENIYLAGSVIAIRERAFASSAYNTKYQHTDALGSPVAVTNDTGTVIERNDYEPYGAIIGNPTRGGIGFTGHVMDGATGLTYMQQRYYDQSLGRFLSVDPVAADGNTGWNFNRYNYAANNPYKFTDPDGRSILCNGQTCNIQCAALIACGPEFSAYVKMQMTKEALQRALTIIRTAQALGDLIQRADTANDGEGRRRKNRIPDRGEPGTIQHNPPGTTGKEYGDDGWVETEWNDGHGPNAPEGEREDHVHDHIPNPHHPDGRPIRQPGRQPTPEERERFKPKPKPES